MTPDLFIRSIREFLRIWFKSRGFIFSLWGFLTTQRLNFNFFVLLTMLFVIVIIWFKIVKACSRTWWWALFGLFLRFWSLFLLIFIWFLLFLFLRCGFYFWRLVLNLLNFWWLHFLLRILHQILQELNFLLKSMNLNLKFLKILKRL